MRSTRGGALDPTHTNISASPTPPVRPPLPSASAFVLLGRPHDSLLLRHPPTPGGAQDATWIVRELFGHQDVRAAVIYTTLSRAPRFSRKR